MDSSQLNDHLVDYLTKAIEWFNPAVLLAGLAIALMAFVRCHKCGYLVLAAYFALVVLSLLAMPYINRLRASAFSNSDEQKLDAAVQQAIDQTVKQLGHPVMQSHNLNVRFTSIVLVIGVWLIARRESNLNHEPPTNDPSVGQRS